MNNSLREGGTFYEKITTNNPKKRSLKEDNEPKKYKYPNGSLPFCFLIFIEIIILLIAFLVTKMKWYDAILVTFAISFCFNCIWLIARQNFATTTKYNIVKHKNKLTNKIFSSRRNFDYFYKYASNNVTSLEEYIAFQKIRKQKSKLMFWISFGIQGSLLTIAIIIQIVVAQN
ncbi:hypothetical protein [Mycoplasmoides alvi]|uniref:hypothetical protein n=1 Tax=Mycoplasmoides alvi TaxID=78580 RepID=UPI00051B74F2|nr:hypothetical protein [Mycoplasmoides alvi]